MARHSHRVRRRRVWPYLTTALAAAVAVVLLGWTVSGALGRPITELIARTAAPTPGPSPAVPIMPSPSPVVTDPDASPLAGRQFWLDPDSDAAKQAAVWESDGRMADAAAIRRIAAQPQAVWFADGTGGFASRAEQAVTAAEQAGKVPVLAASYRPGRDCDGRTTAGAADGGAYGAWIAALAEGLAGHAAVVVLEPDGVAQAVDGCHDDDDDAVAERFRSLSAAIDTLKVNSGVRVYVDAGNPVWVADTGALADALEEAGVGRADGFALNVGGFESTADNIAYGLQLSKKLDGAHFVIDTSRNGNGPKQRGDAEDRTCNPAGRALGDPPTTWTGQPRVDAYLWVKRPGESDGACGNGAPGAGVWWPDHALDLATN